MVTNIVFILIPVSSATKKTTKQREPFVFKEKKGFLPFKFKEKEKVSFSFLVFYINQSRYYCVI